jgi:fibronectin-binding autotransporter adhesin
VAIQSGKGNDTIDISRGITSGVINTGEGKDTFNWQSGTFAGEVNFAGTGGNNKANIGNVTLDKTRHHYRPPVATPSPSPIHKQCENWQSEQR